MQNSLCATAATGLPGETAADWSIPIGVLLDNAARGTAAQTRRDPRGNFLIEKLARACEAEREQHREERRGGPVTLRPGRSKHDPRTTSRRVRAISAKGDPPVIRLFRVALVN